MVVLLFLGHNWLKTETRYLKQGRQLPRIIQILNRISWLESETEVWLESESEVSPKFVISCEAQARIQDF